MCWKVSFVLNVDLKNIIGAHFLDQEATMNAVRDYYELHMQHIKLEDGSTVMVTKEGRSVTNEQPQPAAEGEE